MGRANKVIGSLSVALLAAALTGCASTVAKIFPVGEPITAERCEKLDMADLGYKDGVEAQRPGSRFDFWKQDCRNFGVTVDRQKYDDGYAKGLKAYCSCEKGFESGVKGEFAEFRGQYYMCKRIDYAQFMRGHKVGGDFQKDPLFVEIQGVNRKYNLEAIQARGLQICQAPSEEKAPESASAPSGVSIK